MQIERTHVAFLCVPSKFEHSAQRSRAMPPSPIGLSCMNVGVMFQVYDLHELTGSVYVKHRDMCMVSVSVLVLVLVVVLVLICFVLLFPLLNSGEATSHIFP